MRFFYSKDDRHFQLNFSLPGFPDGFAHTICEWDFLNCNWIDFHLISLHIERDYILLGWEWHIIILGLGVRMRLNSQQALDKMDEWEEDFDLKRFKNLPGEDTPKGE